MDEEKKALTEAKIRKIRNLKYFRDYTDDQIREWYKLRHGDDEAPPPVPPEIGKAIQIQQDNTATPEEVVVSFNAEEYKKQFNTYLNKYKKEYAVDMNETNDVEALRALVRYMLQLERADEIIMQEQATKSPDHRVLKGLGDFQRSIQMNVNELQDKLGISRKQRKEKQHDDIPKYIADLQEKAKTFWQGKTVPVRCETCKIELARYWLNFPGEIEIDGKMRKLTERVGFDFTCYKCHQKVTYAV
jgi:DNA-directed RNA polymerase subunit N (RpoN/RPB10)